MTHVNWPFTPGRNFEIDRAEGVYLYTSAGQAIIDAAGGAIVSNVGHGRQRVADAVAKATLETSYVVPPWITPSRRAVVAALERDWLPPGLTRIHMTSGGSESVESAMKMALQYHAALGDERRTKILSRSISYHGTTLSTTAVSGHPARKKGLTQGLATYPAAPTPYPLRCPLGPHHVEAGDYYVQAMVDVIEREGSDTIAAFLAEPITGSSGGAIVPPDDYWPKVQAVCREYGMLLIFDEVMTGFGRTGTPFGHQHWDVSADILVSGKGLAGGYAPLGGVFTTEAVGAAIDAAGMNVMFHTFGGHPAACAAAAEVLNIMIEEQHLSRVIRMGALLHEQLADAFSDHPHVAEVRGRGLLQAIEIVEDREQLAPYALDANITNRIVGKSLQNGVFFYGGGTGAVRDIVCMGPPFIVEEQHIETMVSVLVGAVDEVTG